MNQTVKTELDQYREQLRVLTEAMSVTRDQAPKVEVDSQFQLDLFAEENFEKRFEKLKMQVEFVQDAFDNLDKLFEDYTLDHLMSAYDRQMSDGAAFLDWLVQQRRLSKKQKDYVTVARARLRIQETAGNKRRAHLRFQELYSVAEQLLPELETNEALRVHVNPVRTRASLLTGTFLEGEKPPVEVLFFTVGRDIRTAVLAEHGLELIEELARLGPCTLAEWSVLTDLADPEELAPFVRQLVELGLAALA